MFCPLYLSGSAHKSSKSIVMYSGDGVGDNICAVGVTSIFCIVAVGGGLDVGIGVHVGGNVGQTLGDGCGEDKY